MAARATEAYVDAADGEVRREAVSAAPRLAGAGNGAPPQAAPGSGTARRPAGPRRLIPGPGGTLLSGPVLDRPGASPFQRDGRLVRLLPFAVVAALAEASLALPPGPQSTGGLVINLVLLAVVAGAVMLPWDQLPRWPAVLVPLAYLGSVLGLTVASGGTNSGVGLVLLVPVVWTALFHRPWESGCVIVALAGAGFLASFFPGEAPAPIIARRVIFLTALAVMISVATHGLRGRLRRFEAATARMQGRLRELSIIQDRDRIASSLHDTVVQRLFTAGLSLQGVELLTGHPEVNRRIEAVVRNLDDAIKLLRQSIFGLEHGMPEHGLRRGILDVSSELTPFLGTVPEVMLDGPIDTAVPAQAGSVLLTALREALGQSGSSAQASRVVVAVSAAPAEVSLTITDNGVRWSARMGGDGPRLSTLRSLATRMGGTLQVSSAEGGDERLVWRVPLAPPEEQPGPPASPAPDRSLPG